MSSPSGEPWDEKEDECPPKPGPTGPTGPGGGGGCSCCGDCECNCDQDCSGGDDSDSCGTGGCGDSPGSTPDDSSTDECSGGAQEGEVDAASAPAEDPIQRQSGGGNQTFRFPDDFTEEQIAAMENQMANMPPWVVATGGGSGGSSASAASVSPGGQASRGGLGGGLSHTRVYQSRLTKNNTGVNGNSWLVDELSYAVFPGKEKGQGAGSEVNVMMGRNEVYFESDGNGGYKGKFGTKATLETSNGEVTLGWPNGSKEVFYDNSGSQPTALAGQLKKKVDPDGNETVFQYDASNGHRLEKQEKSNADGSVKYAMNYEYGSGLHAGVLAKVEVCKEEGGVVTPIRKTDYTYHTGNDDKGSLNDLKTAETSQYEKGSGEWKSLKESYYGYYKGGDASGDGFEHGLKYSVKPEAFKQMKEAGKDPKSASVGDADLKKYASSYLKYDGNKRVKEEQTDGGAKKRLYQNTASSGGVNWTSQSITEREDGVEIIRYKNAFGQTLLRIFKDGTDEWYDYYEYDSENRMTLHAFPSAVASVNDPALNQNLEVTLNANSGKIVLWEYYQDAGGGSGSSSGGNTQPAGYLYRKRIKEGESGTPVTLKEYTYTTRTVNGRSIYKRSEVITYRDEAGGGSQPSTTSYTYDWYADSFQVKEKTTYLPVVAVSENGDGVQYSSVERYNNYGQPTWMKDPLGYITYQGYDPSSGAMVERIRDVDTSKMQEVPAGWATPADGGLHLVTNWESDDLKRKTLELGPSHQAIVDGEAKEVRRARYWVYRDDLKQVWGASGYLADGGYRTMGSVDIVRFSDQGLRLDGVKASSEKVEGRLSALDRFEQKDWIRWRHFEYDEKKRLRRSLVYKEIPESERALEENPVEGFEGEHYDATRFDYDELQRLNKTVSPGGTITRTVYNSRSLVMGTFVGTDDTGATETDPTGGQAGRDAGNNLVQVVANTYDDNNQAGGDGNLTQATYPVDGSSGNDRIVGYAYDYRDRLTTTTTNDGTRNYLTVSTYTNRDLVTQVDRYHTSESAGNLTGRIEFLFDSLGRAYEKRTYGVDSSNGSVGNVLVDESWFDARNQTVKSVSSGKKLFQKTVYDGIGRKVVGYLAYNTGSATNDNSVTNDIVVSQKEYNYSNESDIILLTELERFNVATGTGALNVGPNAAQPRGRASYSANWQDPIGRSIASAAYGTNSANAFTRPDIAPESSDTVLVTQTHYADSGEANRTIDPMGTETRWKNDADGRRVRLIENYNPTADESNHGANRTTEYRYAADGGLSELILKNVVTGDQVTKWVYGSEWNEATDAGIARTDLVRAKLYPESDDDTDPLDDGVDGEFERIEYDYNRQANVVAMTDPNGTVHQYEMDKLGRLAEDQVTTFASHIDDTVKRIALSYDVRGLTDKVSSYDTATGAGTVLNEVVFEYDDFGNLAKDKQAHGGAVDGSTPEVGYAYENGSDNNTRRTSITYPNGRQLDYGYGATNGENDLLSRVGSLTINGEGHAAVSYTYGGLARFLTIQYPEPGVQLSYLKTASQPVGDGGDDYTGYDRFGRVVDMRWVTTSGGAERDRFQWGYDRASNRTWRRNVVAATGHDDHYSYDGLYQVTGRQQSTLTLNQTDVGGVPGREESFDYDPTGNWESYISAEDGTTVLDQSRKNNRDNQVTQFDGSDAGVAYDKAGNATLMPPDASGDWSKSYTLTWDGWNRLVKVELDSTEVAAFEYDGLYRRTTKTADSTTVHFFYSDHWKPLEEREGASTDPSRQYVWGARPGHRDELVLRDRDTTGNGTLDERLYTTMDYYNGTAILDTSGNVQERYEYSAFGVRTIMAPDFSEIAGSNFDWDFGFQGQFRDSATGFVDYGFRYYSPRLGTWLARDPMEELIGVSAELEEGGSLYAFAFLNPLKYIDGFGLGVEEDKELAEALYQRAQQQEKVDNVMRDVKDRIEDLSIDKYDQKHSGPKVGKVRNTRRGHWDKLGRMKEILARHKAKLAEMSEKIRELAEKAGRGPRCRVITPFDPFWMYDLYQNAKYGPYWDQVDWQDGVPMI